MIYMIDRRPLTNLIIEAVHQQVDKPVGDAHAPDNAGWSGAPNTAGNEFIPYVVVTPMTSTRSSGPFSDPQADWQMVYSVGSHGVSRDQAEWMADKARDAFRVLHKNVVELGIDNYKVQQVWVEQIGGITRQDATDPHYFSEIDVVVVWLTKEMS